MDRAATLTAALPEMVTTLAGQKIEAWRMAQQPSPMTRLVLADSLGIKPANLQKYERRGTTPDRRVVNLLVERGICEYADWFTLALTFPELPMCSLCQRRAQDPVVRSCTETDCPIQERRVA